MTSRPVIAHVVHSLATGGLENGVVNLINAADPTFRHVVICLTSEGALRKRLKAEVEVFALGKGSGHDVRALARLVRLLRRIRPCVVHSRNWATFDAIPAARLARVPRVVHGEHGRDISDPEGRNVRRRRLRRLLSPFVDRFVTVSHDLRRWLVDDVRVPARKVLTVHNGVDLTRFGNLGRREAVGRLGLAPDSVIVGTVGRLDPVKGHASLLRAFAALGPARPEAVLVVAGDGPCRTELTGLASELGIEKRVRFLGERGDIADVLAAMDLFVLPSVAEGMSNTILEAMACGLPIVATKVGGNPELVEDRVTGRLVPRQDVAALAGAIEVYLEDPHLRRLHGKASRQRAGEHFGLDRMVRDYLGLYDALLAGRRNRGA